MTTKQAITKMIKIEGLEAEVSKIQDSPWWSDHRRKVGKRWDHVMGRSYDNGEVVLTDKAQRRIRTLHKQIEKLTNSFTGDSVAIAAWEDRYGVEFEVE